VHRSSFFSSDEAIASVGRRFLDRTLPKPEWRHAGHFAATLYLLHRHPRLDLRLHMPTLIRDYNEAAGVKNGRTTGYHETITQASIRAARAFVALDPSRSLHATCNELLASSLGEPGWLLAHYSRERLFSVEARARWREPDVRPLPC